MNKNSMSLFIIWLFSILLSSCTQKVEKEPTLDQDAFVADLKMRTFQFFWNVVDTPTMQTPDRYPTDNFSSIAATGFSIPAYIIGIENKYITREQGALRVVSVLRWLLQSKQGIETTDVTGYNGFYYHFLKYGTGTRFKNVELSTIDTGLLMAGILTGMSYFDGESNLEAEIRVLADSLYRRVNWNWAMNSKGYMSMGWFPDKGFIESQWAGYNEAMVLLIMAMGSPTHPIPDSSWNAWCRTYEWAGNDTLAHINFEPLFGHQYSHMFIDFRGIYDDYTKAKQIDYFENSRRATYYNRLYCIENPGKFVGYGNNIWGLTASDGPADVNMKVGKDSVQFFSYRARGASYIHVVDDGTIAPTAAGGSIPFAPEICIPALHAMYTQYGEHIYKEYGFVDAFNLTYINPLTNVKGWYDPDYLGIDQGPILIQLENMQTGLIWNILKKNPYIISGLQKAGFKGGWLDKLPQKDI